MKDLLRDMLQHMINSFDFPLDMRLSKAVLLAKNNNPSLPKHFRAILNLCHWSRPLHAIQLVTRYIASAWFWVAPLIEPFNYAIQKIISLQNYTLIFALKLGIPMHLSPASAHWALRLRRRAIIMFLDKYPQYSWVVCFIKRKWGYLGHHLRKPDTEGTPDDG